MTTKGKNIYFIRPVGMIGPIKIGCSTSVGKRLESLSVWSPFKLEVIYTEPGDYRLEQRIHSAFADYHSHREWFHPGERLLKAMGRLLAGEKISDAIDLEDRRGSIRDSVSRKPRKPIPAFQRELKSYEFRLIWARKRAEKARGESILTPPDVHGIIDRWKGDYRRDRTDAVRPTELEFQRLHEVIQDPTAHFLTRKQRLPKQKADEAERRLQRDAA